MEKRKLQWETELSKAKEEQASTREKQNSFIDRVTDDVKQLRVKLTGLQDKHRRLGESHIHGLSQARETMSRKRTQARKQWEAEEKAYFEKVSEGKQEAMRKAAAEGMGPKLERLVQEGKEEVRRLEEKHEASLSQLRRQLQVDMERRVTEAAEQLNSMLQLEDEKDSRMIERRCEDLQRDRQRELDALKERYERERAVLEETAERNRRLDLEAAVEARKGLRAMEISQIQEETVAQQREVTALQERLGKRLDSVCVFVHRPLCIYGYIYGSVRYYVNVWIPMCLYSFLPLLNLLWICQM